MSIETLLTKMGFYLRQKTAINLPEIIMNPLTTSNKTLAADESKDFSLDALANYQPLTLANKAGDIRIEAPKTVNAQQ